MPEEESDFELVMPFVVCQSSGGPYEDAAFVGGWRLGCLDSALKICAVFPELEAVTLAAPPIEEKQIDLIAMKHGFQMVVSEYDEDWSIFSFERGSGAVES